MRTPFSLLPIAAACCLSVSLHAQQNSNPLNAEELLREIDALEQKQKQVKNKVRDAAISKIRAALAKDSAAASLYEQAIEDVQFQGKKGKVSDYSSWKNEQHALLQSREAQAALFLHLKYLLLSIQRTTTEQPEVFVPETLAYLNELVARDELITINNPFVASQQKVDKEEQALRKQQQLLIGDLLNKPLSQSLFVQWLRIGEWLPEGKTWEDHPGNVAGILEKNVRPAFRTAKDPRLVQTWDYQIKVEADHITLGRSAHQIDMFNSVTRPTLLFRRAQDMAALDQQDRALGEMMALVRTYPEHPDIASWMEKARKMLKSPAKSGGTSPQ